MISRVAESCYWLMRYLERADNTARVIGVNLFHMLDEDAAGTDTWQPVLVVTGEGPRFRERFGEGAERDGELVQRYLTWDEENPSSIQSCVRAARDNARTIRETISREMWESLNLNWLWLQGSAGQRMYERERSEFFEELKRSIQAFRGTTPDTILHEEPLEFMRLGVYLERPGMIARILDVRHHMLAATHADEGAPIDFASWHAILRSCGGIEAFLKRGRSFKGPEVAAFVVGDPAFPRSIRHCLSRAAHALERIVEPLPGDGVAPEARRSPALLAALRDHVAALDARRLDEGELHAALTHVVDSLAAVGRAVHTDFFELDEAAITAFQRQQ